MTDLAQIAARLTDDEYPYPGTKKQRRELRAILRERDGDECCLIKTGQCLHPAMPVEFDVPRQGNPLMASIEHIVERRAGGKSTLDNMALAHLICNQRRSNPGSKQAIRDDERRAVVAWLRKYPPVIGLSEMAAWNLAAHIERREYLRSQANG